MRTPYVRDNIMRILLLLLLFLPSPVRAMAYCSEPSVPYCAERFGPFDDSDDFDRCRREMESYQSDIEQYAQCLRDEADDAVNAFNDAVERFNRRARGY